MCSQRCRGKDNGEGRRRWRARHPPWRADAPGLEAPIHGVVVAAFPTGPVLTRVALAFRLPEAIIAMAMLAVGDAVPGRGGDQVASTPSATEPVEHLKHPEG